MSRMNCAHKKSPSEKRQQRERSSHHSWTKTVNLTEIEGNYVTPHQAGVAEVSGSAPEHRLHVVPLINSWAVKTESLVFLYKLGVTGGLAGSQACPFGNLSLPEIIAIFIPL